MTTFDKIRRAVAAHIPGSAANLAAHLAEQKRQFEKEWRAQGYSRNEAKTLVATRFNKAIAPGDKNWHNNDVPVEQDVQSASSLKPVPGALAGSRPHGNVRNTNSRK